MLSLFPGGQEASELRGAVPWEWRMCVAHLKWHGCTGGRFLVSAKAACSPGYKSFSLNSVIAGAWRFTEWRGQPLNFSFCFYVSLSCFDCLLHCSKMLRMKVLLHDQWPLDDQTVYSGMEIHYGKLYS